MSTMKEKVELTVVVSILLLVTLIPCNSNATFSMVAVDTSNGAVGAAGATCTQNVKQIISGMVRGKGAINHQNYTNPINMTNALNMINNDYTAESILAWLLANDADYMPEMRQYGIATIAGVGNSATFTGSGCFFEKLGVTGPGYAIQGNGLISQDIILNMESAFLGTDGPLEEKLMAALNAADIPGADAACESCNKPGISAFITVMHVDDAFDPYLNIDVPNTTCTINPLDSVRYYYNLWQQRRLADAATSLVEITPDTLAAIGEDTAFIGIVPLNFEGNPPTAEPEVALENSGNGVLSEITNNGDGTFSAFIVSPAAYGHDTITVSVTTDGEPVTLDSRPELFYYRCGDATGEGDINLLDILHVISNIYDTPPGPDAKPHQAGDANGDGVINLIDILYLIDYVYGTPPGQEPICPE